MQKDTSTDRPFIPPMRPQELAQAISTRGMDTSSKRIRGVEWQQYLRKRRQCYLNREQPPSGTRLAAPDGPPDDLTGIALSGGGIRSATFALGVLQALAHRHLLERFDYLSTVSGGGYIGSSLTWLTSKKATEEAQRAPEKADRPRFPKAGFGLDPSQDSKRAATSRTPHLPFPYGSDDPSNAREPDGSQAEGAMLRYLRQHGNYLTPGKGITLTSVIVVLLRGIILNLLVWIPIIAAVMCSFIWISLYCLPAQRPHWFPAPIAEFIAESVDALSPALESVESSISPSLETDTFMLSISPQVRSDEFLVSVSPPPRSDQPKLFVFGIMLATAILLFGCCVLAFAGYSLMTGRSKRGPETWFGSTKYDCRRWFERSISKWFRIIGALLLLASVPFIADNLQGWLLGPSFSFIGLASGLLAFMRTMQQPKSQAEKQASWAIPSGWIASFGAAFLLYGVLLMSYGYGVWAAGGSTGLGVPFLVLVVSSVLAIATGVVVDLNQITIHRFYCDRLMETFLPDIRQALDNETAPASQADSALLSEMCHRDPPVGPYHIINTNLVLINSDQRAYRMRGGDSFMLSPLYCGSNATGWQPTHAFMGNELTLPTAMAISGAAANPWTGSGGVGLTRNPLVSILMALMNLRLGFWLRNPNFKYVSRLHGTWERRLRANHFDPGLKEVLGCSLRETAPICLLSDGGHFENLGLYELIRRRVRLIVLCDGTADPDYAFADLHNAMARVWADFGARIEFDKKTSLKCFMPTKDAVYPREVRLSKSGYAVADITYADDSPGKLVYLTTALCEGLRLRLLGYKSANRDFPNQSTADQFFDEEQFEAYRELGYFIANQAEPEITAQLDKKSGQRPPHHQPPPEQQATG